MKHLLWCLPLIIAASWSPSAWAQFGRPGGGSGGMAPSQQKPETPQGPAEAAPPEEKEGEPEIPPLPAWPGQETRKLQFFEMRGYFRFRWNMHHNLNLGMSGDGAPFYTPLSENDASTLSCAKRASINVPGHAARGVSAGDCPAKTLGGADMRLRLEPLINVGEKVRIHTQIDVFDNLELGSTPRSLLGKTTAADVPMAMFSDTQAAPIVGRNTNTAAILVKRAWAEIDLPVATLRVGRMPSHWGMGLLDNDGSCWNCNLGKTADRIMLTANVIGHTFAMGYDFHSSGFNTATVSGTGYPDYYGVQPVDLEKLDDVSQWFWLAGKIDPEDVIQDKVERGEVVINYGALLYWRKQDFDWAVQGTKTAGLNDSAPQIAANMIERHAWTLNPDLWFKLLWRKLYIEVEGTLVGGKIENASLAPNIVDPVTILQWGWALRSRYSFLKDSLKVYLELGMASGQADEPLNGEVNRHRYSMLGTNADGSKIMTSGKWNEFRFDYDYQVDLILFREILGSVSNAFYFKPSISYDIVESFGAKLDLIYSAAVNPVGYPGNSTNLGFEIDLDLYYRDLENNFFAGLSYGVLIPFAGLNRPEGIYKNWFDTSVAHTLQGRLFVKF